MQKGEIVQWNKNYWLRHLTTNKYLKVGNAPFHDIDENVIINTFSLYYLLNSVLNQAISRFFWLITNSIKRILINRPHL